MRTNWREVAEILAGRLVTHAFCDEHPAASADPECPFCQDRAAYRTYLAAGGPDKAPPRPSGHVIALADISPGEHLGVGTLVTAADGTQHLEFRREPDNTGAGDRWEDPRDTYGGEAG